MPRKTEAAETPNLWEAHKRQSIQDGVIRLMCREGLNSVTMERVAQEVGIAKGTVYLHYRDKQELLDDVKNAALDPLVDRMMEVAAMDEPADRKLLAFARGYLAYFDDSRDLFRILLYEREVTRVNNTRFQTGRYRKLVGIAAEIVREGTDAGILREVNPRMVGAMLVESIIAIVNQRLSRDVRTPVDDDAELIADLFLRGTTAEPRQRRRGTR
jgi:AcrR family transcriptional regulator